MAGPWLKKTGLTTRPRNASRNLHVRRDNVVKQTRELQAQGMIQTSFESRKYDESKWAEAEASAATLLVRGRLKCWLDFRASTSNLKVYDHAAVAAVRAVGSAHAVQKG